MPLLDILGVDGLDNGFTVGFALLDQEAEEDHNWAIQHLKRLFKQGIWPSVIATDCDDALINAIKSSFPPIRTKTVLCYWHISQNVITNCKRYFQTEERWEEFLAGFRRCIYAKTEEEFEDIVNEWKEDFHWNDGNPWWPESDTPTPEEVDVAAEKDEERLALLYCLGSWLGKHKEQVVHAWTDLFFHGGTTTTSRLEGAHSVLKRWIGKPSKNLTAVWRAIKLAIDDQMEELRTKRATARSQTPLAFDNEFYSQVLGKVTPFALYQLRMQWSYVKREQDRLQDGTISAICSGSYYRSMGVLCWHMIKECLANGVQIGPLHFHPHYHWLRPPPGAEPVAFDPPILDPETRQRRRSEETERRAQIRAHARVRRAQTGRILSQHEQGLPALRHCSACIEFGHDKATCRGCRSTGHTRASCPHVPRERESAIDSITRATEHQSRIQRLHQSSQPQASHMQSSFMAEMAPGFAPGLQTQPGGHVLPNGSQFMYPSMIQNDFIPATQYSTQQRPFHMQNNQQQMYQYGSQYAGQYEQSYQGQYTGAFGGQFGRQF
jgi:hypothetical protein